MSTELVKWAEVKSTEQAVTLAKWIVDSRLYSNVKNQAQAIMILAQGAELGLRPVQSLNLINVIQGRPALTAQGMLAVIMSSGQAKGIWVHESDAKSCTWKTIRRDEREAEQLVSFTIEEAKALGLTNRDQWKKQPATMLKWRALSKLAREIYPDVIGGLYTTEEVESFEPEPKQIHAIPDFSPDRGFHTKHVVAETRERADQQVVEVLKEGPPTTTLADLNQPPADTAGPTKDLSAPPEITDADLIYAEGEVPFAEDWITNDLEPHQRKVMGAQVRILEALGGAEELAIELWNTQCSDDIPTLNEGQAKEVISAAKSLFKRAELWARCWRYHKKLKASVVPPETPKKASISTLEELIENYQNHASAKGIKLEEVAS